ncbi:hypothetical protein [Streptomyces sp. NPDC047976]|uniref:hypothetical protein n=1 Tax=unclassified Streptomyces TaxID=2593676 RepID=UPI0034441396
MTIGAAFVLLTGLSGSAQAAAGDFTYVNVNGDDFTLHDPRNGECFLLVSGASSAVNRTNTKATVFVDHGCEESSETMQPNTSVTFSGTNPHSVMFG